MRRYSRLVIIGLVLIYLPLYSGCSVLSLKDVVLEIKPQVAVNGFHSVYLDAYGKVWTWGVGNFGQLGTGVTDLRSTPTLVEGLPPIASVAVGGSHVLALTTSGQVWAWGHNADNVLGVTTTETIQSTPIRVTGLDHVTAIAAGDGHGLALRSDGTVWTWGINTDGQTGLPQTGNHPFPEQIQAAKDVIGIAAGDVHSLLLQADGTVWTAGLNNFGQLGDGTTTTRAEFAQVPNMENIVAIDAGETYSLALDASGDIWGFGNATLGQLGLSDTEAIATPKRIFVSTSGQPYRAISAGGSHAMALDNAGNVWSWGYNGYGQLGYATASTVSSELELVPVLDTASSISAGDNHSAALSSTGRIWMWGDNQFGQLGDGTTTTRTEPDIVSVDNDELYLVDSIASVTTLDSSWTKQLIDEVRNVGGNPALAYDGNGKVHMVYQAVMDADLKYATNASGDWVIETIATENNVGSSSDIIIDAMNRPHICYYVSGLSLQYATRAGVDSWQIDTVDDDGDVGGYCSIGIDSTSTIHLSYYDWSEKDLRYAHGQPGAWITESLATAGDSGTDTALQVDGNDNIHIAYYEPENFNEHYMTNQSGAWEDSVLEPLPGGTSGKTRLALAPDGTPHLAYNWQGAVHYATFQNGEWFLSKLPVESLLNLSVAVDPAGRPWLVLSDYDYTTNQTSVRVFTKATAQAHDWQTMLIDTSSRNVIGPELDIAVAADNSVGVVFYDRTAGDVWYAAQ